MDSKAKSIYFKPDMLEVVNRRRVSQSLSGRLREILRLYENITLDVCKDFSVMELRALTLFTKMSVNRETAVKVKQWDCDGDILLKAKVDAFTVVEVMVILDFAQSVFEEINMEKYNLLTNKTTNLG